nr:class I SAM-dependent methyltransferase [Bradyrhizobium sp. 6(2017)]QIG91094.1 class I SAM-dependent methyltransferase [Bradyrhizobium sp. 6(2017)]
MSDDLQGTIPLVDASVVDRWDKEWMHYLSTESKWPHLIQSSKLRVQTDVRHLERAEIFATSLTMTADAIPMAPLRIWATGSELVQRSVAEIGCGAGFLGKQIGLIATRYLGIDVSQLALAIARGNSGPNCSYLHIGERTLIAQEFGKYDTVLGREFFIHQNFPNAMQVLRLAKELLVGGGRICADFYLPNPNIEQGVVHPARAELDSNYASCAFAFSTGEVQELAQNVGLNLLSLADDLGEQRRFVVFVK